MIYYTYILTCSDRSFYVGHTNNVQRRIVEHNAGRGARYTAIRRPVNLSYVEEHSSLSEAVNREKQIKGWTKAKKQALIEGGLDSMHSLAKRRQF